MLPEAKRQAEEERKTAKLEESRKLEEAKKEAEKAHAEAEQKEAQEKKKQKQEAKRQQAARKTEAEKALAALAEEAAKRKADKEKKKAEARLPASLGSFGFRTHCSVCEGNLGRFGSVRCVSSCIMLQQLSQSDRLPHKSTYEARLGLSAVVPPK